MISYCTNKHSVAQAKRRRGRSWVAKGIWTGLNSPLPIGGSACHVVTLAGVEESRGEGTYVDEGRNRRAYADAHDGSYICGKHAS